MYYSITKVLAGQKDKKMHKNQLTAPCFTGEFFIPGKSGNRLEQDHMERYLFAAKFAQGKNVLDIACGSGYSSPLFVESGAVSYLGVDINKDLVKYANESYLSDIAKWWYLLFPK